MKQQAAWLIPHTQQEQQPLLVELGEEGGGLQLLELKSGSLAGGGLICGVVSRYANGPTRYCDMKG